MSIQYVKLFHAITTLSVSDLASHEVCGDPVAQCVGAGAGHDVASAIALKFASDNS